MRWVGIDEAGYGPNLGPLVMTAVVVEAVPDPGGLDSPPIDPPSQFWDDLSETVCRAGRRDGRLWVDDSKAILKGGKGRDRLVATCLAALDAADHQPPDRLEALVEALCGTTIPDPGELARWTPSRGEGPAWPGTEALERHARRPRRKPFAPSSGRWRISHVRSVIVGPERFNEGLARHGSKAGVHFEAFQSLLREVWELAADSRPTHVSGDKHGGRHYYGEPLRAAFPEARIHPGPEGPALSEYALEAPGRKLNLRLTPRADAQDGLVALASIVSKTAREAWMDVFNAFWAGHVPGLKPTAGYPVDAARFRRVIEPASQALGLEPRLWWRER